MITELYIYIYIYIYMCVCVCVCVCIEVLNAITEEQVQKLEILWLWILGVRHSLWCAQSPDGSVRKVVKKFHL